MDKESIFNSPRILFFARCSFFNVCKISNEQSSSSSNDSLFFTFGKFVPRLFKRCDSGQEVGKPPRIEDRLVYLSLFRKKSPHSPSPLRGGGGNQRPTRETAEIEPRIRSARYKTDVKYMK